MTALNKINRISDTSGINFRLLQLRSTKTYTDPTDLMAAGSNVQISIVEELLRNSNIYEMGTTVTLKH